MWLRTKLRTMEKKIANKKDLKISSDFRPALKKLKAKVKKLVGDVKTLKETNGSEYFDIRSSYRILVESLQSGKSISSLEKSKKADKKPTKKAKAEEEPTTEATS